MSSDHIIVFQVSDRHHKHTPSPDLTTNLLNFSFCDHKYELNRVLNGYRARDQLIDDVNDLWLFVNKYEALLKRSGQCILPIAHANPLTTTTIIPKEYDKSLQSSIYFSVPFDELMGRLTTCTAESKITPQRLRQFLQIVVHYLDFKQKEKFQKLRKLRRFQANLPVAQYKNEIIEAVRAEQVVLIAGDTGCGKSTQVPQYLHDAGFQSIGKTKRYRKY